MEYLWLRSLPYLCNRRDSTLTKQTSASSRAGGRHCPACRASPGVWRAPCLTSWWRGRGPGTWWCSAPGSRRGSRWGRAGRISSCSSWLCPYLGWARTGAAHHSPLSAMTTLEAWHYHEGMFWLVTLVGDVDTLSTRLGLGPVRARYERRVRN